MVELKSTITWDRESDMGFNDTATLIWIMKVN